MYTNVGFYISSTCCCTVLYADDTVLIAPSVSALQTRMLTKRNQCAFELVAVSLYRARKSLPLGKLLRWVDRCRYLGVYFTSSCLLNLISLRCLTPFSVQDAQLSQSDRTSGCITVLTKSGRLELGHNILRSL